MPATSELPQPVARPWLRLPFYYGWIIVGAASVAMSATLPGRSHGLGLITEPLIKDLGLERTTFAWINLFTSLLGAAFCLLIGSLLDRYGTRIVMLIVTAALGAAVIGMAYVPDGLTLNLVWLSLMLLLVRGFGQSALSVVSIAAVGKWFRRRLGAAMGVYCVLMTFGFIGPILVMKELIQHSGWRAAWSDLGWLLLVGIAPISWLLVRNTPEECGQVLDAAKEPEPESARPDFTLRQALCSPIFWVFAVGSSTYNLVWSGVTLFNESVLEERGFDNDAAGMVMAILVAAGLPTNFLAGAVVRRERLGWLLGLSMVMLTLTLLLLPSITARWHLWLYGGLMGSAGGLVMVVFFAAWGQVFGRKELGRIQGAAQIISVLESAVGPLLLAESQKWLGGYDPILYALAGLTAMLAIAAVCVRLPKDQPATEVAAIAVPSHVAAVPLPQES